MVSGKNSDINFEDLLRYGSPRVLDFTPEELNDYFAYRKSCEGNMGRLGVGEMTGKRVRITRQFPNGRGFTETTIYSVVAGQYVVGVDNVLYNEDGIENKNKRKLVKGEVLHFFGNVISLEIIE